MEVKNIQGAPVNYKSLNVNSSCFVWYDVNKCHATSVAVKNNSAIPTEIFDKLEICNTLSDGGKRYNNEEDAIRALEIAQLKLKYVPETSRGSNNYWNREKEYTHSNNQVNYHHPKSLLPDHIYINLELYKIGQMYYCNYHSTKAAYDDLIQAYFKSKITSEPMENKINIVAVKVTDDKGATATDVSYEGALKLLTLPEPPKEKAELIRKVMMATLKGFSSSLGYDYYNKLQSRFSSIFDYVLNRNIGEARKKCDASQTEYEFVNFLHEQLFQKTK